MAPKNVPKMQATLSEYLAWAFEHLRARQGEQVHEFSRRVLREWLDSNEEKHAKWGISPEMWQRETGGNVAQMEVERKIRRDKKAAEPAGSGG